MTHSENNAAPPSHGTSMFARFITKPSLVLAGVGLVAVSVTGCGDRNAAATSQGRNAADGRSDRPAQYVEDPWVQRTIADQHQHAAHGAMDSPCFMSPDHWNYYVKHGYLVCIAP